LDLTNSITGVLGVPNGGTGRQDIEQYAVVMGNGTNPLEWVNVTASPYPLISNGTSAFATFQPLDLSSNAVTGVLSLSHIPNIPFSFLTGTIPLSDLPFSPYSTYITDIGAASWTASFTGYIMVEGWGGGGGSSQSASVGIAVCYGAASGGYFRTVDYVVQGDVINYVVGDGGANAGSFGVTGDTGGTTVWNGYAAAFGGTGSSNTVTGLGGSASGGNVLNLHGRPGEVGDNISRIGGAGGAAPLGGAGGQDDYASGHDGFQPGGGASGPGSTVGYDGNRGGRGAISITRIYLMTWWVRVLNDVVQEAAIMLPDNHTPADYFPASMPGTWVQAADGTPRSNWTYTPPTTFTPPAPPPVLPLDIQQRIALGRGVALTSTSHPELDGTYACNEAAQQIISSESLYIQATAAQGSAKFSNGQTTRGWPDTTGTLHTFPSTDAFISFAEGVAHYVDSVIAWALTGAEGAAPSNEITIA
jgi:hypothetical protein